MRARCRRRRRGSRRRSAARAAGCSGRSWSCRSRSRRPGPASRRAAIVKSTPSTAFTSPILRVHHDALGDREVHVQARAPRAAASAAASRSCRRRPASRAPSSRAAEAGGEMARARRPARAAAAPAAQRVDREPAARPERAAAVEPRQVGRLALDRIEPRLARPVEPRHRAQQRHRVGMARVVIDRIGRWPALDDAAGIHDVDPAGVARDHAEIVRDDDQRDVRAAASAPSSARGSAPGSSRRAPWSARRR